MKTLKEIMLDFNEMCKSRSCVNCKYIEAETSAECRMAYLYDRLVEAFLGKEANASIEPNCQPRQNGADTLPKPATADKPKAVEPPKWCKVGAWVKDANGKLYNIECIDNGIICIRNPLTTLAYAAPVNTTHVAFNPVRFRPYTYKEAKGLLGKVIEYVTSEGYRVSQSVHSVQEGKGRVYINDADHEEYMRMQATIDGVPIGVPEIDKEAMKEVEE